MNTLLISLGGSAYPSAAGLRHSSFAHSSRALSRFLSQGEGSIVGEGDHLDLFDSHDAWARQLMAIRNWLKAKIEDRRQAGQDAFSNVLVHYVGHGMFKPNSADHFLSINETDADYRTPTSASLGELNDVLLGEAAWQRRIYLIDACFAAASVRDLMGAPEDAIEVNIGGIIGAWPSAEPGKRGVAALCSADRTATSDASGQRNLTQFTDGLLAVFENGDSHSGKSLTLRRVHELLRRTLTGRYEDRAVHPVLVAPEDADGGIAAVPIFKNLTGTADRERRATIVEMVAPDLLTDPQERAERLTSLTPPIESPMVPEAIADDPVAWNTTANDAAEIVGEASVSPEQRFRQIAYRFFRLPRSKKDDIVMQLRLQASGDEALPDFERFKALLARVRDSGAIEQLEQLIVAAEGNGWNR